MTLPAHFRGPVEVTLARSGAAIRHPESLSGGAVYEPKWDGFRLVAVRDDQVRLWSRRGNDLTDRFLDIAEAVAAQVETGAVLDDEVVVWDGDHLDFDALQGRLTGSGQKEAPASYVAFDLLAVDGTDLRPRPFRDRRSELESLAEGWPPLQVTPWTGDFEEAQAWFEEYRAAGVEGLVVKGAATPYRPGERIWIKVKNRRTEEVIAGAVLGTLMRPTVVIAGRYRGDELLIVGRTSPLSPQQSTNIGGLLQPASPDHPWPDFIPCTLFDRSTGRVALIKVKPRIVLEVSADPAMSGGLFRHSFRYIRLRRDLTPHDVAHVEC